MAQRVAKDRALHDGPHDHVGLPAAVLGHVVVPDGDHAHPTGKFCDWRPIMVYGDYGTFWTDTISLPAAGYTPSDKHDRRSSTQTRAVV